MLIDDVVEPIKQQIDITKLTFKKNTSKVYPNGSRWKTNKGGYVTIVEQLDRPEYKRNGNVMYRQFLLQFDNGFYTTSFMSDIQKGKVKNPYTPSVFGVGYLGAGEAIPSYVIDGKSFDTQEYSTWRGMLDRCYSKDQPIRYPTYKDVTVHPRWHNFNTFWEDIKSLKGYNEWKEHRGDYALDKDILSGEIKIYSRHTCQFITAFENGSESAVRGNLTGDIYKFIRISDNFEYITDNQADFADKTGIGRANVHRIIHNKNEKTFGWRAEILSDDQSYELSDKTIPYLDNVYLTYYEAERISDGYKEEFTVQRHFAKKYDLSYKCINKCLQGGAKTHREWKFKRKENKEGEVIE